MEAERVVRRNSGDGSRLYGRGCFSFGGLVSSHLPNLFHPYCRANGWLMCKNPQTCFFIALYVLYTYMLKQRRKVLGKGKTVGGVNKAR